MLTRLLRLFGLLLLLLSALNAVAISTAESVFTRFDHLSLEDGLSQATVFNIVQDRQGFLWFGTQDGLNRYDGYHFKVFRHDPKDPNSISNNWIEAVFEDHQGRLWIGTGGGLNRFEQETETFVRYTLDDANPNSLSHHFVLSIAQDRHGTLWLGTRGGGLNRFDESSEKFSHYRHSDSNSDSNPNSLSSDSINSITADGQGNLWLSTDTGLNRFNIKQQQFSRYQHQPSNPLSISDDTIQITYQDSKGQLWVGTGNGLNRFDEKTATFERFSFQQTNPDNFNPNSILSIFEDNEGLMWFGTSGSGLYQYDDQKNHFIHFSHNISDPHSLNDDYIWSIYQDRQGALWIGTEGGGINKLDTQRLRFGHIKHQASNPRSLSQNVVMAIYKDTSGTLWVGTENGLNRYDQQNQHFIHYKHRSDDPDSLSDNRIYAIHEDNQGSLWFGTINGLNRYHAQSQKFTRYQNDATDFGSISSDLIYTIYQDRKGVLWIGTGGGGLNKYHEPSQSFIHYKNKPADPNSISDNFIYRIHEGSDGLLWLATDGGLNSFNPQTETFESYQHQPSDLDGISHNFIQSIHQGDKNSLWIGTYGGGLNHFDLSSKKFTHYRKEQGLANDVVYGIVEDISGQLWLSTNQGLSRFDPQTKRFKNYNAGDGLQGNEFNQGAYFKSDDGELFFGGINGFNRFYPDNIYIDTQPPAVVLTDFLLANQSVAVLPSKAPSQTPSSPLSFTLPKAINALNQLSLTHQQNLISFEFAALHFTNPMKNQYAFKLEGQHQNWIYTGAENRRATYTNLAPGDYTLRIKASNTDGYWNTAGKSLKITVLPPPWKTWWAYLVYIVLIMTVFGSMTMALVRAQQQKLLAQKNQALIDAQQQLIQSEKMISLGTLTAGVAHEINNPVNFVHVSSENLEIGLARFQAFLFDLTDEDTDEAVRQRFVQQFEQLNQQLTTIKEGTERIKTIVQDLRTFTQLDSAEQKAIKVTDLLQSTINLVHTQYSQITEFITDFATTAELDCYPAQLNQVFMHLIVNACDAIYLAQQQQPGKGQIAISCHQGDGTIEISIQDNGCGMSNDTQNKLFEPFYTTKDVGKGTGLGLSISFGIVQKHGGTLTVESQLGIGSVFNISLPVARIGGKLKGKAPD